LPHGNALATAAANNGRVADAQLAVGAFLPRLHAVAQRHVDERADERQQQQRRQDGERRGRGRGNLGICGAMRVRGHKDARQDGGREVGEDEVDGLAAARRRQAHPQRRHGRHVIGEVARRIDNKITVATAKAVVHRNVPRRGVWGDARGWGVGLQRLPGLVRSGTRSPRVGDRGWRGVCLQRLLAPV
jgi:hypothetical protein